jgi:hypothetical protein
VTPSVEVGRPQTRDPPGWLPVVSGLEKRGVGQLDLIETLVARTASRHERDERVCGTADELLGIIVGSNGKETEPLVDVIDVRVGAVPVHGNRLGIQALGPERVGVADHPTADATGRNDSPNKNSRSRQCTTPILPVASQCVGPELGSHHLAGDPVSQRPDLLLVHHEPSLSNF